MTLHRPTLLLVAMLAVAASALTSKTASADQLNTSAVDAALGRTGQMLPGDPATIAGGLKSALNLIHTR